MERPDVQPSRRLQCERRRIQQYCDEERPVHARIVAPLESDAVRRERLERPQIAQRVLSSERDHRARLRVEVQRVEERILFER